ncbi:probable 39S ribosomal protein L45, mitochondrial [Cephus cinctus]|uniref:Large ribosomal subunit protein mL45 n=1 Tax=Cephus cinctus TaxID=211228 RepID=A0AAJ7FMC0_CEPCN|nr:probable 39S ribosomal protein L45, mitochondrial [Cephus cinctus]
MARYTSGISTVIRVLQNNSSLFSIPVNHSGYNLQHVRGINKHWNPKWKKFRREKVIKVKLPNFEESDEDISEEKTRSKMKEFGVLPKRIWMERPTYISCTGGIFEAYVPPEGDGKFSAISTTGAKQKFEFVEKKSKSYMAIRKIRDFEPEFDVRDFAEEAREIYIKAHEALSRKDKHALRQYITERAYPEMLYNAMDKTIHWKFLQSLEPPRIVHARSTHVITKSNIFSQLTVRFHNQQQLAIYDRFGRLMCGSEILKKDVLEYIVFEKHVANEYGLWRIHAKIIPPWMPPSEFGERTYVQEPEEEEDLAAVTTEKKPEAQVV